MKKRKQYSATFKLKVVLETLKEEKTVAEISSLYEVHPTMVNAWRQEFQEKAVSIFENKRKALASEDIETLTDPLYKQIGRLQVENDFLQRACDKLSLKPGRN
jgi:transposase